MTCQCQVTVTVLATYHNSKVRRPVFPLNPLTISLQPLCPSSFSLQRRCHSRQEITQSTELFMDRELHANQHSTLCLQCIWQSAYPSCPPYFLKSNWNGQINHNIGVPSTFNLPTYLSYPLAIKASKSREDVGDGTAALCSYI